jgi:hypothetical protein
MAWAYNEQLKVFHDNMVFTGKGVVLAVVVLALLLFLLTLVILLLLEHPHFLLLEEAHHLLSGDGCSIIVQWEVGGVVLVGGGDQSVCLQLE